MALKTQTTNDGKIVTIFIPDKFDFNSHQDFRSIYSNARDRTQFILDFSKTEYIDSSALGMLLLMREDVLAQGGDIKIIHCRPHIMNLLVMANFHQLFNVA